MLKERPYHPVRAGFRPDRVLRPTPKKAALQVSGIFINPVNFCQHLHLMAKPVCMLQIKIPKPCHEDWNAMTPTTRGAFCSACSKDVVDFTSMSDDEVQHYLLNKAGEKVCGKFNNTQLHRIRINIPNQIFYSRIAGWKKFMAVVMLAFGSMLFGCDVTTETVTSKNTVSTKSQDPQPHLLGDTIYQPQIVGALMPVQCSSTKGEPALVEIQEQTMGVPIQEVLQGDVEIVDTPRIIKDTLVKEEYEIVGGLSYTDAPLRKSKKDSLSKFKLQKDSAECGEHFY